MIPVYSRMVDMPLTGGAVRKAVFEQPAPTVLTIWGVAVCFEDEDFLKKVRTAVQNNDSGGDLTAFFQTIREVIGERARSGNIHYDPIKVF